MSGAFERLQDAVFERRIRLKDQFTDFDPLRKGHVSQSQFARALRVAVNLTPADLTAITAAFVSADGSTVNYVRFVESVDAVFAHPPEKKLSRAKLPADSVLHRIALLCKTRGVVLKYSFQGFDKLNTGNVTDTQFRRAFPFADFSASEIGLLIRRYGSDTTGTLMVNYRSLNDDVAEVDLVFMDPYKTGNLVATETLQAKPRLHWHSDDLTPVQKIQTKVFEKRVKLEDFFHDFDPLRHGVCQPSHLTTVLTQVALEITDADLQILVAQFSDADGRFEYRAFCAAVEAAFYVAELEKQPAAEVTVPDTATLLKGRRDAQKLSGEEELIVADVEQRIRLRTSQRGIYMLTHFIVYDKTRLQRITKNQFTRAMLSLGFQLTKPQVKALAKKYCNLGNADDFNYRDFCDVVDPTRPLSAA